MGIGDGFSELTNQRVLGVVGVLILINQDVPKAPLVLGCDVRK